MKEFWDQRYSEEKYAYGTEPNTYFSKEIKKLNPGRILFPAEGEGRNAVFTAGLGWDVIAYDYSKEGKSKAIKLAKENGVEIQYHESSHEEFFAKEESFDCIVLIFVHTAPGIRSAFHQKMTRFLKPEGTLILEGFSKEQILNNSGGPKNVDMLFSEDEIRNDFSGFSEATILKKEIDLREGLFHRGEASVIRFLGKK